MILIDGVQNLRLDFIDLAVDRGNRRGRRGVDAAHQGGFLTQESDDVVDIEEGMPGNPLICNGVLETSLGRVQIIDDRLLIARIDSADELSHGIVEDEPGNIHRVDLIRNAAIRGSYERLSIWAKPIRQHISPNV